MEKKNCSNIIYEQRIFFGKCILFLVVIYLLPFLYAKPVFAVDKTLDTSFGFANYLPVTNKSVSDGDIVSFSPRDGYYLTKLTYDASMVGVVTTNPAISLEIIGETQKSYPVVSTGNSYINVTTTNGNIKKGDPITSSTIPGVAMKAINTGYIIGAALEDYASNDKHAVKKIAATLNVHYFVSKSSVNSSLFDVLNLSTLATYQEPIQAFKYVTAALIMILSFIFGFFSFARTANKGLEALGRNPLAGHMIELGILLNIVVAIIIVLSGLVMAFVVIRL